MQLLVLGMHRSGTSMVARLLNMMGAYFAPEGVEMPAHRANPKGFWERKDVYELCKKVLASAGCDWQRVANFDIDKLSPAVLAEFDQDARRIILGMDAHRPWFLKEPRLCVLAPLWLQLLEFPVCVFVHRSPLEVACSLQTRNEFPLSFGLALWERYNIEALNATRGQRRIQINHADLMADPVITVRQLQQKLEEMDVGGLRAPSDEEIRAFIDPTLYRAKAESIGGRNPLSMTQRKLLKSFQSGEALLLTKPIRFSAAAQTLLQSVESKHEIDALEKRKIALSGDLEELKNRLAQVEKRELQRREKAEKEIAELKSKVSQQAEAIERRNLWREKAENAIAELRVKVSLQAEAIERRNQWREKAEKEVSELRTKVSEQAEAIERRNQWREKAEKEVSELKRKIKQQDLRILKLKEFLKQACSYIDRLLRSSRWKLGSLLTFRSRKPPGRKAKGWFMTEYKRWERTLAAPPSAPVAPSPPISAKALGPGNSPPFKPKRAEQGDAGSIQSAVPPSVSPQFARLREFDVGAIDLTTAKLATPVSIVVPMFNGASDLERCIESVLRHTAVPFELVLVDDCSPDPAIGALLAKYEANDAVRILRQSENRGFVRSANVGMRASTHDVILLNSDTEVTPRWRQKLTVAAYSDPRIATVTPFSNAAGAFSVPEIGVNTPIQFPFTPLKMSRLTERLSTQVYPEVPTGNGFCMFIKRQVLDEIGGFDEENFGRGYGEENDFCMRARQTGWRHVIDDSAFVYHRGNSSFGEEKQRLLVQNREALNRLHPDYTRLVREFTGSPEINALRTRIGQNLRQLDPELQLGQQRILYILHEGTGGVPMTNADLVSKVSNTQQCFLLTSTGTEMILREWRDGRAIERQRWKLSGPWSAVNFLRPAMAEIYFQVLVGLAIDLVHIRHLFKHSFDAPFLCRALGIPTILSFHDYYFACPSIHLLDQNAKFCGGQCTPGLEQCTIPSPLLKDLPMLKPFLPRWRERVSQVLDCCDAFVTTAESVRKVHLAAFPQLRQKPFWVIEHGRDLQRATGLAVPPRPGKPVRILAPGNVGHSKGSHFIREMARIDTEGLIEFHFLGKTDASIRDIGVHHGTYKRADFLNAVSKIRPSFAAIFSIWAETYSHTLTEAWGAGLPVFGSNLGAVGERIAKHGGGWLIDTADPAATLEKVRAIVNDDLAYQKAVREVDAIRFQTVEGMACSYCALYAQLLAPPLPADTPRVGYFVPAGNRGSTFLRVSLPLAHEEMRKDIFAARLPATAASGAFGRWIDRLGLTTVFLQREALTKQGAVTVVETCRTRNIRLVFEIDDNLLDLDPSHTDYAFYKSRTDVIRYLAEKADQIVVSTQNLLEAFRPLNEHICVIENTLDEWIWFQPVRPLTQLRAADVVVVGYMGTKTHGPDLEMIREPFLRARRRLKAEHQIQLRFEIIGGLADDPVAPKWYRRLEVPAGSAYYPRFVRWLRETVKWDFALAPLRQGSLNHSKSALKFFEYAGLGVPGIFSRTGEYPQVIIDRETGLLVDPDAPEAWEAAIVELGASPALRQKLAAGAREETIARHLLVQKIPEWFHVFKPA